jgi:hypothetical protein
MTASTRRRLAVLLTGTIATLVALSVATLVRENACSDAGGRWAAASRTCADAAGAALPDAGARAYAMGALAGLVVGVLLWRTFTFLTTRAARRSGAAAPPARARGGAAGGGAR